jgi:hypothetical protein
MALALDSRDLNPLAYLLDATAIVVWPPLHAIFLSVVMSVFGVNSALGLVPGLCGWILMTLCVWQISQKVSDGEAAGIVAGSVALIFTVASPALRLLSADVMLEGLGAGLSAANLLIFIYLSKYPSRKYLARLLALGLTLLFFTKFNYWLILVFSLLISCASGIRIGDILSSSNRAAILSVARSFLRNPVTLLAVVLFAIMLGLAASGPTSLDLFGRTLVFRASQWVVIPYGLLVVSACHVWHKNRDVLERNLPEIAVTILGWHAVPVLLWFLVPEAITSFVWFVGPTHWGRKHITIRPARSSFNGGVSHTASMLRHGLPLLHWPLPCPAASASSLAGWAREPWLSSQPCRQSRSLCTRSNNGAFRPRRFSPSGFARGPEQFCSSASFAGQHWRQSEFQSQ